MKKKIFLITFLLLILISTCSLASYSTVTMTVVEEPICTIDLGNNSQFEKKSKWGNFNTSEKRITVRRFWDEKQIF